MIKTRKAILNKPPRVIIFGTEGVGKSNFMVNADKPVIISLEDRVDHLKRQDGQEFDIADLRTWDEVRAYVKSLIVDDHDFKSLGIDSLDWLEKLCHAKIIGSSEKDIIRVNGGYSAGLRESEKLHRELISDLSILRDKKGMAVVCTAHYQVKEEKNPEAAKDYDTFQIKLDERVSSLWREWADAILFARFNTYVKNNDDSKKGKAFTDHERSVYASKQAFCQAKNVYGMPLTAMPFGENFWNDFSEYVKRGVVQEKPEDLLSEIDDLTKAIKDEETKALVMKSTEKSKTDINELKKIKNRLKEITANA